MNARKPKFHDYIYLVRCIWHYRAICTNYRGKRVEVSFTDSQIWDAWEDEDNPFHREAHKIIYSRITQAYHEQNQIW